MAWLANQLLRTVVGGALLVAATATPARAQGPAQGEFAPLSSLTFRDLVALVGRRSAALQGEQLNAELAEAEARQSRLLNNPVIDIGWGTVPIGQTNPPGLSSPLSKIPNYSVGVSYTFPWGKRGARARRADALVTSAWAGYEATAIEQALGMARVLGQVAVLTLRQEGLRSLVEQSKGTVALAKSRVEGGYGTPLEQDRLEIELGRVEQQVQAAEAEARSARASCAAFIGVGCGPFASGAEARAFLEAWIDQAGRGEGDIERRPDLRALGAQQQAAAAEAQLARALSLPDPTVRVGYLYDTFTLSGNQLQSLNFSLSLPLPLFDHGQAAAASASARHARLGQQRRRQADAARSRLEPLRLTLEQHRKRQSTVTTRLLPKARAVVTDLERAAASRLLPLTDVIAARRTVDELILEEVDSLSDAFQTSLELLALAPPAEVTSTPRVP